MGDKVLKSPSLQQQTQGRDLRRSFKLPLPRDWSTLREKAATRCCVLCGLFWTQLNMWWRFLIHIHVPVMSNSFLHLFCYSTLHLTFSACIKTAGRDVYNIYEVTCWWNGISLSLFFMYVRHVIYIIYSIINRQVFVLLPQIPIDDDDK